MSTPWLQGGVTYEYVDLGLPSGLKWAKCNIGAETETDYGDYFQWGETTPDTDYTWATYKHCNGSYTTMTKYNTSTDYGENPDNKTTLESEDDAAIQIMGGNWRMPTSNEFKELFDNTTNVWVTNYNGSGINGRKFTGSNGNSIFFPTSGYADGTVVKYRDSNGYYWSSSLYQDDSSYGLFLIFNSGGVTPQECDERYFGMAVRGVRN